MDGSIHNRALTNLLCVSGWTAKSAQVLGDPNIVCNREGCCGKPIRSLEGEGVAQGRVAGGSGQHEINGIPNQSLRRIGTRKVHPASGG